MNAHLVDCTYCVFQEVGIDPKRKNGQTELCKLTYRPLIHPKEPGRFCEAFHQKGHTCDDCYTQALARSE